MCDYRIRHRAPTTTASGARRCATTTPTASTATARTAWTRTATTRPSAASTRRARPTASPARPTAARTRCRSPRTSPSTACSAAWFEANINYHSAGQLLLTPVSYTTDYCPPDSTLFDAITGTDGDEAVFPYRSQHSSDLYESNGDTIDNAYMNYGIIGWTPEMDTCATLRRARGLQPVRVAGQRVQGRGRLQQEPRVRAQRDGLDAEPVAPKNFDNDPSHYQVKPTQDIQLNRFDVSYGASRTIEATSARSSATPTSPSASVGQNGA